MHIFLYICRKKEEKLLSKCTAYRLEMCKHEALARFLLHPKINLQNLWIYLQRYKRSKVVLESGRDAFSKNNEPNLPKS